MSGELFQDLADLDRLAELVANRLAVTLQASVLRLPPELVTELNQWSGWRTRRELTGGPWPVLMETEVMQDGGLRLQVLGVNGLRLFERVLTA